MKTNTKSTLALIGVCISFFMVIADVTAVNVALPNIQQVLHTTISALQWVVAGYTLTFACFLLFSGYLADLLGAKRVLMLGLLLFILMSLACALSPNINILIWCRLLQGIAGATLVPCSLSLINAAYTDRKVRAQKVGVWASVGGLAAVTGPMLGGLLTGYISWRAVFFANIPFGFLAMWMIYSNSVESEGSKHSRFDAVGLVLSILCVASLSLALIESGSLGWNAWLVRIAIIIFFISTILFILTENCVKQPMLPLRYFKISKFSIAVIIGMVLNFGIYGELFVLPLYFHHIRGYSIIETGMALLPLVGLIAITSYISGKLVSAIGVKTPLIIGLFIGALGFLGLWVAQVESLNYYWLIIPLAAMGFGIACCQPAATVAAIHALPKDRAGLAAAIFTTSRQIGSLLGVAIFGNILATASHFVSGFHATLIISAALYLCALMVALFLPSKTL